MAGPWESYQSEDGPWSKFGVVAETPKPEPSFMDGIKQAAGNAGAGLVRGAGSIGETLLAPIDAAANAVGINNSFIGRNDRRESMDQVMQGTGVDTESIGFQGSKLASEIAGTAGAGGLFGKALTKAAPTLIANSPRLAQLMEATRTGGFSLGTPAATTLAGKATDLGLRTAGGTISGYAMAGMVNPDDANTGALIGGALPGGVKLAKGVGSVLNNATSGTVKHTLGMATGTGGESVATAYNAGKQGATIFKDNMRGNVPMTDVLDSAKQALTQMRLDRSAKYKSGMAGVSSDKTVIDFAPIDQAVSSLKSMGNYKGQIINKNASGVVDEISGLVDNWKGLNPAEYHTPEGLDALKQAISDIRDTTQFGTAGRKAADTAYNAVKAEITNQAPTYAKVMKDYSVASETLSEVERALSLGNKAAADTSMRKLQSLMRNNVNTNFGNRLDLAKTLERNGADILPAVAGQSMSSWTPRGLSGLAATGAGAAGLMTNPLTLAALPATSPRLIGEAAYGIGAMNRGASSAGKAVKDKISGLLGNGNPNMIPLDQLSPYLVAAPILSYSQR